MLWNRGGRTGNFLKVDQKYGPYYDLISALGAAVSGTTIEVYPGTYTLAQNDQLFKDGVNWIFQPGAIVNKTNTNVEAASGLAYGIFDDRASGAVTCLVEGLGEFFYDAGVVSADLAGTGVQRSANANIKGTIVITNASSNVSIRCARSKIRAYTNNIYASPFYVASCALAKLTCDECLDTGWQTQFDMGFSSFLGFNLLVNSTGTGPYWESGEAYVFTTRIHSYIYGVYAVQTGSSQTSFWVEASTIETTAVNTVYILGDETKATSNWRVWIVAKDIRGGVIIYNAGKHYVLCEKIGVTGGAPIVAQTSTLGFEAWITVQKLSTNTPSWVTMAAGSGSLGTIYLTVQHYEDTGTVGNGLNIARGTLLVFGGYMKVLNGVGCLVSNAAASVRLNGLTIDTSNTNSASNLPCSLTAAGTLILNQVVLVASALADSIKGSSPFTVKNYGCVTNKDKNANITLSPNAAFTIDSAVS